MEIGGAIAVGLGLLGIVSVVTVAVANIIYNRPRIDALAATNKEQGGQIAKLERDTAVAAARADTAAATALAALAAKDRQFAEVADLVKSVPAFQQLAVTTDKLTGHVEKLGTILEEHAYETRSTGVAIVNALTAIAARLERKSEHRDGDPSKQ